MAEMRTESAGETISAIRGLIQISVTTVQPWEDVNLIDGLTTTRGEQRVDSIGGFL
jgi:hypothetical protein